MDTDLASTTAARTTSPRRQAASRLPAAIRTLFHPAVANWFAENFAAPTPAQAEAWPAIKAGRHTLIAAPTGSGKTLAAFMSAIDDLVRQGLEAPLADATQVVYVSPLKALSNDIHRNLEAPLAGVREQLRQRGLPDVEIRTWVRTGDTPAAERDRMRRRPPHILVTTPELLYVLLGSQSGRAMLKTARSVIVDEIHAVAPNKRGAHLALSLERLAALCGDSLQRIGLSATQNPIRSIADFLAGAAADGRPAAEVAIIDAGHHRQRDLSLEIPGSPLESVMSKETWTEVYARLTELISEHRTTLVFVNTRRMAERVARELADRLGDAGRDGASRQHGEGAETRRRAATQARRTQGARGDRLARTRHRHRRRQSRLPDRFAALDRDLPAARRPFGPRHRRHAQGAPLSAFARRSRRMRRAVDSVRRGELDRLVIPERPLDVLAQQIVAEAAAQDWPESELYDRLRRAWPFRSLSREDFDATSRMLAEGFATRNGRRGALIHRDAVNHVLRGRRGARTTALTSGGTIPDTADYQVLLEPENHVIGTVNEDFAVESMAGDIFQLGNASYRIQRVERGTVRVEDAKGQPPNIPFWLGEAPGRTDALSAAVSRLRAEIASRLAADRSGGSARRWLVDEVGVIAPAADQLVDYLAASLSALGSMPTQDTIVFERFFDEAGGMQLVIHSPFGSRLNRAWGLALRKRFCRKFNFELQAAATEDNIVLSLTTAHSFELGDVARYLHSNSVRQVLVQAMLDAPMFTTRWRWVAGVSLALPRFRNGKKVPPQLLRMQAEDLVAAVFPDQIACAENLVGEREVPDHPLTNQAIADCLHEAMDIEGLERLLKRLEAGDIEVVGCDLTEPSPLALEALSARPYAFLDDAPLEERRTQAVMGRRWRDPESASDLGRLDGEAIAKVQAEAWPDPVNAEELHDALLWLACLTEAEARAAPGWSEWLEALARDRRVTLFRTPQAALWIPAERLAQFQAVWPEGRLEPQIAPPDDQTDASPSRDDALVEILRGRLEGLGPVTPTALAAPLGLEPGAIAAALAALERDGAILKGRFLAGVNDEQWCDRRLLARIHHYTVRRLRSEIEPVAARDFLRFLFSWQHVAEETRLEGPEALPVVLNALEGFEAPAKAWETEILPARLKGYQASWLDAQCLAGRTSWARLTPPAAANGAGRARHAAPVGATPIALIERRQAPLWMALAPLSGAARLSGRAEAVLDCFKGRGALFFDELVDLAHLLRHQLEEALGELVALGLAGSDSFAGLRALIAPSGQRKPFLAGARRRGRVLSFDIESGGRWAMINRAQPKEGGEELRRLAIEHAARTLLDRYGVVFWRLLMQEPGWLPPWRDLLRVYRRLEARGEIRGGRFVAGFSGEQFALPDAVGLLREMRRRPASGQWVSLSGADPLNLIGILTPGQRLSALTANRIVYRDGLPVAALTGGKAQFLTELESAEQWEAEKRLVRSAARGRLADLV